VSPEITIVVLARERFSTAIRTLEHLYEVTDTPFDLVYVDGRSPRRVRDELRRQAARHGFTLLRHERYLTPNSARNLGLAHVSTPFVLFIDNDMHVTPGWLQSLLDTAKETGAWAVGPLYFEGDPADEIIHMAGGDLSFDGEYGHRAVTTVHRHHHLKVGDVRDLRRGPCGYAELHTLLLRTDVIRSMGGFDERYKASREHLDLCLRIRADGGEVWFEPASRVTYMEPPPVPLSDLPFFWLRWSDAWSLDSLGAFCDTYGIDRSYLSRVAVMRERRMVALDPVLSLTSRVLGDRAASATRRVLYRVEPRLNRVWSTALTRAGRTTTTTTST
jgi:GT2 family glycosyltransferase